MQRLIARSLILVFALLASLAVPASHAGPTRAAISASAGNLQLTVSPKTSASDTPLTIRISGLRPGARVTLSVASVDAAAITWGFTSTYTARSAGIVDPATATAKGGVSAYDGTDPMGPVDFMGSAA